MVMQLKKKRQCLGMISEIKEFQFWTKCSESCVYLYACMTLVHC